MRSHCIGLALGLFGPSRPQARNTAAALVRLRWSTIRYHFAKNTANLNLVNFNMASEVQIETILLETFTITLTFQKQLIFWSENPDFCKSLRKHIVYAGQAPFRVTFVVNISDFGIQFYHKNWFHYIGLSIGPLGNQVRRSSFGIATAPMHLPAHKYNQSVVRQITNFMEYAWNYLK